MLRRRALRAALDEHPVPNIIAQDHAVHLPGPASLRDRSSAECRRGPYSVADFYGIEWPTLILANTGEDDLPHRRGEVEALLDHPGGGDPVPVQEGEVLEGHPDVAGEAVELVDHDHVQPPGLHVAHHAGEGGALVDAVGAGRLALLGVLARDHPAPGLAKLQDGPPLGVEG